MSYYYKNKGNMSRPNFIKTEDILRWSKLINSDPLMDIEYLKIPEVREVCYAGLWLCEELDILLCPISIIERIQFIAAKLSYKKDPWNIHQNILNEYINGSFILDSSLINTQILN